MIALLPKKERSLTVQSLAPLPTTDLALGQNPIPMIRPFFIFDKLIHIHFSDRQWFEQESTTLSLEKQPCPSCGAHGCLAGYSRYTRYLVEIQEGYPVIREVTVPRYRCSSCGHTHAALSSCLVPYRSYTLRFILYVLRDYFLHRKTVSQICADYGIAPSTLYCWKELFMNQKAVWLGVLENLAQENAGFLDGLSTIEMYHFLEKFHFSFLERMPGRVPETPLGLLEW